MSDESRTHEVGDSGLLRAISQFVCRFRCRPFHGLEGDAPLNPGVPLRSTPGFMLSPAPRAMAKPTLDELDQSFAKFILSRVSCASSWIVLILALCVCSCVKLSRTVSTDAAGPAPLVINATPQTSRININTASARDLDALPGVGIVLAERILAHRTQYGPFRRVEHLMMVRGFSDSKFRAIRERVTVE